MSYICLECGWLGDPTAPIRSVYRKAKGCPACGGVNIEPVASRAGMQRPAQVIQPADPIIKKMLEDYSNDPESSSNRPV